MKNGKFAKRGVATKSMVIALAVMLIVGATIGGTIAWLSDTTAEVVNTFTYGDINITLDETTGEEYQMVPGNTIDKDPTVTVVAGSEDCYLFVKIVESANLDTYIEYTVADGWTALAGVEGVYWREALAGDEFSVLANDQVTVKTTVTKADMEAIKTENQPTLTFTAYAVQKANVADAAAAWAIATGA